MALTAAERQRRHRLKMKAEGRQPKQRKQPAVISPEAATERRQKATERKRRWRQAAKNHSISTLPIDAVAMEEEFLVSEHEPGMLLDTNGVIVEHLKEARSVLVKEEPELQLEFSGSVVEEAMDDSGLDLRLPRADEISDVDGEVKGTDAITREPSGNDNLSLDALIAQQQLEKRRRSAAERQRRHRSRLRAEGKYEQHKQKHKAICVRHRTKRKEQETALPEGVREDVVAKRREGNRVRVARHRERKKHEKLALEGTQEPVFLDCPESGEAVFRYMFPRHNVLRVTTLAPEMENPDNTDSILPLPVPHPLPHPEPHPPHAATFAVQTDEGDTSISASVSADSNLYVPRPEGVRNQSWQGKCTGRNETQSHVAASESDYRYITPPIWPCNSSNQNGRGRSPMKTMWSDHDNERPGTSQLHQGGNKGEIDQIATGFDQNHTDVDHPSVDDADMPQELQNEVDALQHQSPLVYNYMKKLQSDNSQLRTENRRLRKQTLCLDGIRQNKALFKLWTEILKN